MGGAAGVDQWMWPERPGAQRRERRSMSETTARLRITRRSGKVRVVAEPGSSLAVDGGTFVENDDGTVDVRAGGSAVLEVRCPTGSDLTISTASGAVDVEGDAGSVKITTKSG